MGSRCCSPVNADSKTINVPDNINDLTLINQPEEDLELNNKIQGIDKSIIDFSTRSTFTKVTSMRKTTNTSCFKLNVRDKLLNVDNYNQKKVTRRITILNMLSIKESKIDEEQDDETVIEEEIPKIKEEFIQEVLTILGLLKDFDNELIEELILAFFKINLNKKDLYKTGEDANLFYIIDSGCVELSSDKGIQHLSVGDYFGIESLEENQIRTDSARTIQPSILFCLPGELYRNAKEYMNLKNINDKFNIIKILALIKNLDQINIISLCQMIVKKEYQKNTIIVTEGVSLDRIFLIMDGIIRISKNNKKVKILETGEYFGEINLITKKSSFFTYSVQSERAIIYELPYIAIKEVLGENYVKILLYRVFMTAIYKSERINEHLFENVNDMFSIFSLKYYTNDEVVFSNINNKNKKICIVLSGKLRKQGKPEIVAKSEELYGESIVDSKTNLQYNIVSDNLTLLLEAQWEDILKSFKPTKNNYLGNLYETVTCMRKIPIFSTLSEIKLFQLAKGMTIETFTKNEEIIREGSEAGKFYIIKTGKVKVYKRGKFIRELENGSCFGEISLLPGMIRVVTVVSNDYTDCFVLNKDSFNDIIDKVLLKHLQKIICLQDIDVSLENLYYIKVLGNGKFGKVLLAHNKKSFYAVKYGNIKSICSRENLIKYYINEKNIMMQIDHPFIVKLVKTIKNKDNIFFLLEYIDGISLKLHIDKRKKQSLKNTYETAFYGSILLCVVNYLHNKRILHRDIKPDNCIIDLNGYLKLIDFGISKQLQNKDYTSTCCGSPQYSAPEVILGKGYSYSADYWSVGVVMYEIFYGYLPFGTNSIDIMDIYNEIINKNLILTHDSKFNDINNFFKIVLSKNLIQRVCNFNLLRSHPFFHNFDFDKLTDFDIKPPFIPESYIEQSLTGGVSLLSHTNMPFNYYMNNEYYDEDVYNEKDELYEKEIAWVANF